jgi:hypothetical protein
VNRRTLLAAALTSSQAACEATQQFAPGGDASSLLGDSASSLLGDSFDALPTIDLRRFGLDAAASGATNRAAFEQALAEAALSGGGILQAPSGVFELDRTVTINTNGVLIRGAGSSTAWRFNPSYESVLFDFTRGTSSIWLCGVTDCVFYSSNLVNKTAVRVNDGRSFLLQNVCVGHGHWPGPGSVGLHTLGRECLTVSNWPMICARPVLIDVNQNDPTIHTDFFSFVNGVFGSTEQAGVAMEIADGVNLGNIVWERLAFVLGKWAVRWTDTTSRLASYGVVFRDCRSEQASDATGYTIELSSSAQRTQQLTIDGFIFDNARNGLKLSKCDAITLRNAQFNGGQGRTNLDIEFDSLTTLELTNTTVQAGSSVKLNKGVMIDGAPYNPTRTAMTRSGRWCYDESVPISQRPAYGYNEARVWQWSGSLATGAALSTPVTRSAYTCATVTATAYSEIGPVHCTGTAGWTRDGVTTKHGGSPNFVVDSLAGLRVADGGSGLIVINGLGRPVDLILDIVFR